MPVSAVADADMLAPAVRCGAAQWGCYRLLFPCGDRPRRRRPQV
ncbi:hypothetical protein XVE_2134 [Xanthomonas vesicatoria ATCC 35937]|uniref:Uncharacterized protein n=1 Tax=Xanthomonas vesicatoria ATCC 35937 TaxID=925775 RepID=F0BDB8_9XANT|nr:hypothetical protein XVE_2134 [Xanthomonas vesicatoria ATCC 35937]